MAPRRRRGADSDSAQDEPAAADVADAPKNRPPNTAFRQQRMRAWQCVLTPKLIVTVFSVLAAIYLGFGAYLTYLAYTVRDITVNYSDCMDKAPRNPPDGKFGVMPEDLITYHFSSNMDVNLPPKVAGWKLEDRLYTYPDTKVTVNKTMCLIQINIPEDLKPTVSFYYYLENFYQNHRRYVGSFNAKQLLGEAVDGATLNSSTCDPVAHDSSGKIVYPCGIVANSMFNDSFSSPVRVNAQDSSPNSTYLMSNQSITWPGLKDLYGKTKYDIKDIVPPPNWVDRFPDKKYTLETLPDLATWEGFQNWMMLAAAPNFYKLYQRNDRDVMQKGKYQIDIASDFNTTIYNGRKSFVITTVSTMGSRNIWPGIIFLIVGGICLLLDVYFILSFFLWKPRKLGDPSYLSWNQPSAAGNTQAGAAPL
ncbi:ligand-effect modulator 3 family [Podospora didyma]|uniref:Ligand-effect modulator 3 family n=1 Tax=Podospora didyma TaxID=330526 RepID=A0AAE0NC27_9PEZI|nr:ligand-effect modulator 3 family [Podospora didyma]